MTTKNKQKELTVAQRIFDLDNQYEALFHASDNVVNRWRSILEQMYRLPTESMKLFNHILFGVAHVLLNGKGGCQPQIEFNKEYGSRWKKLHQQSPLWETLAGILYKKALLRDKIKPGMNLNEITDELIKDVEQQYGNNSNYYKLITAYRIWLGFCYDPIIDEVDAFLLDR